MQENKRKPEILIQTDGILVSIAIAVSVTKFMH